MQGQYTSGANAIAQMAAKAAVEADPKVTHDMLQSFLKRRDFILAELGKIDGLKLNVPQGAFYIFPNVEAFFGKKYGETVIQSANDLSMFLVSEAKVATVPGEAFGNPNCIRLSYATSDELLAGAAQRIQTALAKLS